MKTKAITLICLLILICCSNLISKEANIKSDAKASGKMDVYCTPDLFELTSSWALKYNITNPKQKINVIGLEASEIRSIINSGDDICFISNELPAVDNQGSLFRIVLGREIMVPVISSKNPFLKEINEKGISRDALVRSLVPGVAMQWGTLLNNGTTNPVKYFILDDASAKSEVSGFLKGGESAISGMTTETADKMLSSIGNDPYAIGFCRLTDLVKSGSGQFPGNIQLMPIDKNGNGKIDYMENIYSDFQDFSRGVWIGKYPKALTSNIYCVSKNKPVNSVTIAFLQWVLTTGQDVLPGNGFSDLVSSERQSQIDKLNNTPIYPEVPKETNTLAKLVLLILIIIVISSFIFDLFIRRSRAGKSQSATYPASETPVFEAKNVSIPKGLYFDKTHTWAYMEQDGNVKVGIDDFLQHVTGPITSIGMKKPGDRINKGDRLCIIIQKGKQLNIFAPVSGIVRAFNETLLKNSTTINTSPFTDGWVYLIEPSNWVREIEFLSMADKYRTWLNSEFNRLKDFLASSMQANSSGYSPIILQDGGVLKDHVLEDLGPEVWEDFQTKFINTAR